jgi:CheY-like chemotaxis protein
MSRERIVIVADDDENIRETVTTLLSEEGYETRAASEGREALMALDSLNGARCVLILDLLMPKMSGFEVLDVLSNMRRLPDVPVIVCSGVEPPKTLPDGVHQFITKPISFDALLMSLETL